MSEGGVRMRELSAWSRVLVYRRVNFARVPPRAPVQSSTKCSVRGEVSINQSVHHPLDQSNQEFLLKEEPLGNGCKNVFLPKNLWRSEIHENKKEEFIPASD